MAEAIASVLDQSRPAGEVIVVDDGSSDETAAVLASFGHRIRVIRHERPVGVSAARNAGIRAAAGDWFAFLDSDDLWKREKLAQQLAALAVAPDYLLCYTDEEWRRDGRWMNQGERHRKHSGWIYRACLPLCLISPSSALIRRDLLDECGLFDENLPACEDYDLWLRITSRHPVLFVPERLIVKRAGDWPQLSRQFGLDRYRIMALLKMVHSDFLTGEELTLTRRMLLEKCRIYAVGCRKHGREEEARWAEEIYQRAADGIF